MPHQWAMCRHVDNRCSVGLGVMIDQMMVPTNVARENTITVGKMAAEDVLGDHRVALQADSSLRTP